MHQQFLPLQGIRVLARSNTLAVRLAGLLLADQGAEVFALSRRTALAIMRSLTASENRGSERRLWGHILWNPVWVEFTGIPKGSLGWPQLAKTGLKEYQEVIRSGEW
jgi:hypothetical protein